MMKSLMVFFGLPFRCSVLLVVLEYTLCHGIIKVKVKFCLCLSPDAAPSSCSLVCIYNLPECPNMYCCVQMPKGEIKPFVKRGETRGKKSCCKLELNNPAFGMPLTCGVKSAVICSYVCTM